MSKPLRLLRLFRAGPPSELDEPALPSSPSAPSSSTRSTSFSSEPSRGLPLPGSCSCLMNCCGLARESWPGAIVAELRGERGIELVKSDVCAGNTEVMFPEWPRGYGAQASTVIRRAAKLRARGVRWRLEENRIRREIRICAVVARRDWGGSVHQASVLFSNVQRRAQNRTRGCWFRPLQSQLERGFQNMTVGEVSRQQSRRRPSWRCECATRRVAG